MVSGATLKSRNQKQTPSLSSRSLLRAAMSTWSQPYGPAPGHHEVGLTEHHRRRGARDN